MTDEQVLAEAMGLCYHVLEPYPKKRLRVHYKCIKCGKHIPGKATQDFQTPAELWNLLMYMTGREDWANFYSAADFKYTTTFEWGIGEHCFIQWLLTATYTDENGKEKLLFVKLCADWCREHEEKGE